MPRRQRGVSPEHGSLSASLPNGTALLRLLPLPRSESVPSPPACQGLHRKQEVFLHKGAGRQTSGVLVLPGLGSGNLPFLHLSIQHMLKCLYCVPVTVLDTGDSLSVGEACATLFSILVISPGVGASGF